MPTSSVPVSLAEVLEVQGEPLNELEIWAILYNCCRALQTIFLKEKACSAEGWPRRAVTPDTTVLSADGQIFVSPRPCFREIYTGRLRNYVPVECNMATGFSILAIEKIYVYSLARTLQFAAEYNVNSFKKPRTVNSGVLSSLLNSMCRDDAALRPSLDDICQACCDSCSYRGNKEPAGNDLITRLYRLVLGDNGLFELPDLTLLQRDRQEVDHDSSERHTGKSPTNPSNGHSFQGLPPAEFSDIAIASNGIPGHSNHSSGKAIKHEILSDSSEPGNSQPSTPKSSSCSSLAMQSSVRTAMHRASSSNAVHFEDRLHDGNGRPGNGFRESRNGRSGLSRSANDVVPSRLSLLTTDSGRMVDSEVQTVSSFSRSLAPSGNKKKVLGPVFLRTHQTVQLFLPEAGGNDESSLRHVEILLLNGIKLDLVCCFNSTGRQLFDFISSYLSLPEPTFFGLAFDAGNKVHNGEYFFIEAETKLHKVAPAEWKDKVKKGHRQSTPFVVYFRVKFYVSNISILRHQLTHHLFYLQLRRDVLDDRLLCTVVEQATELAALAVRAEYGSAVERAREALVEHYLSPSILQRVKNATMAHESLMSSFQRLVERLSSSDAEARFIQNAVKLPQYGYHLYKVSQSPKNVRDAAWIGIGVNGVLMAERHGDGVLLVKHVYGWSDVQKISLNRHRFSLKVKLPSAEENSAGQPILEKINHYTDSFKKAEYLLQLCQAHHRFQLVLRMSQAAGETLPMELEVSYSDLPDDNSQRSSVFSAVFADSLTAGVDAKLTNSQLDFRESSTATSHQISDINVNNEENSTFTVNLTTDTKGSVGINATVIIDADQNSSGVFVRSLTRGGPAAHDGRLCIGDQLLSVNGQPLDGVTQQAVNKLFSRSRDGNVKLVVLRTCSGIPEIPKLRTDSPNDYNGDERSDLQSECSKRLSVDSTGSADVTSGKCLDNVGSRNTKVKLSDSTGGHQRVSTLFKASRRDVKSHETSQASAKGSSLPAKLPGLTSDFSEMTPDQQTSSLSTLPVVSSLSPVVSSLSPVVATVEHVPTSFIGFHSGNIAVEAAAAEEIEGDTFLDSIPKIELQHFVINKADSTVGFGFGIVHDKTMSPTLLRVAQIVSDSVAELDGRLRVGDKIIKINDSNVAGLARSDAVELVKSSGNTISLVVWRSESTDLATPPASLPSHPNPLPIPPHTVFQPPTIDNSSESSSIIENSECDDDGITYYSDAEGLSPRDIFKYDSVSIQSSTCPDLPTNSSFPGLNNASNPVLTNTYSDSTWTVLTNFLPDGFPANLNENWISSLPILVHSTERRSFSGDELRSIIKLLETRVARDDPREEFKSLKREPMSPSSCEAGLKPENRSKNRYRNVLPFDSTRVCLFGDEDYINASHITYSCGSESGNTVTCRYIATQGPLPHTVADFWRMVWEHDVDVIAMTTQTIEAGRAKCTCYWPVETGSCLTVGQRYRLTLLKEHRLEHFDIRWLQVDDLGSPGSSRVVVHLGLTSWPDHGVPADCRHVLQYRRIMQLVHRSNGPIVVHCSAGVGRTGTLIAIDVALTMIENDLKFDFDAIVRDLRKQRHGLIQTDVQYCFCYETLLAALESLLVD